MAIELKLIRDFIPVRITCKLDEDPFKREGTIIVTRFSSSGAQG